MARLFLEPLHRRVDTRQTFASARDDGWSVRVIVGDATKMDEQEMFLASEHLVIHARIPRGHASLFHLLFSAIVEVKSFG